MPTLIGTALIITVLTLLLSLRAYLKLWQKAAKWKEQIYVLEQGKAAAIQMIRQVGESIEANDSQDALFARVVRTAVLSVGALSVCLYQRTEDGQLHSVASEGLFPPQKPLPAKLIEPLSLDSAIIDHALKAESLICGQGLIGLVAESGEAILIPDAREDERVVDHSHPSLRIRSLIAVPVLFRKQVIGVLAVVNKQDGGSFAASDLLLLELLAEQTGMAIHYNDLLTEQMEKDQLDNELALAKNIQGMLLPGSQAVSPHLDIDARYLPARRVSGDFYDYFPLPDGRIAVAIADVSGKGVPAALLMTLCLSSLRCLARYSPSPARTLIAMNETMRLQQYQELYITLVYGIIDPVRRQLTLARAGHDLPLLCVPKQDGTHTVEQVKGEGMALGLAPGKLFDSLIEDRPVPFSPGSVLLLYSDGLTEARNDGAVEFSSERLMASLAACSTADARTINDTVLQTLDDFTGDSLPEDDRTLLTVRYVTPQ